ncbi:DUF1684 domain-containing protein [Elizabethkingia sp. JS20170427COW]|uniref:DUF1684 domain-containing protein n=1 Tax=Elizabethkingia sp. JS20170427COW TaxID=2583851 RepID=UPI0011107F20|nr:DUF1684 domain-containing protein [Elizabethkingia sp. JS20170427COW]QCX54014.1 DUF1684 domain-containing protein [Elizabethkingia sp. JS20170427COW]
MRLLIALLCGGLLMGQTKHDLEIKDFQDKLNLEFKTVGETPLRGDNLAQFKKLPFFDTHPRYKVKAKLVPTQNAEVFDIPTSSGKTKKYKEYGTLFFKIDKVPYSLKVYQSHDLIKNPKYKDYLFLPFRDETNGKETYGGGRYLDLKIPKKKKLIVDFNKAYNPFCAYNALDYNCPIVPLENKLPIAIKAGVKYEDIYY